MTMGQGPGIWTVYQTILETFQWNSRSQAHWNSIAGDGEGGNWQSQKW